MLAFWKLGEDKRAIRAERSNELLELNEKFKVNVN